MACKRYECLLLMAFHSGEVSAAEAKEIIDGAHEHIARAQRDPGVRQHKDEYLRFHFGVKNQC